MRVVSQRKLREFWEDHPDSEGPLRAWFKVAERSEWGQFADVRATYSHADLVGRLVVFDIGGNKYRLIVHVRYDTGFVYVKYVLSHADYDRGDWKDV